MEADLEMIKARKSARTMYIIYIATVMMVAIMFYVVMPPSIRETPASFADFPTYCIIMTIAAGAYELAVFIGLFLFPRQTLKIINKIYKKKAGALSKAAELRGGLFSASAILGLLLGTFGAGAAITIPFFVVAAVLLFITFPTEERWQKWGKMLEATNPASPEEHSGLG